MFSATITMLHNIQNNRFFKKSTAKILNNKFVRKFIDKEDGLELVEWGILLVIIAGLITVAFTIKTMLDAGMVDAQHNIESAINQGKGGGTPDAGDVPIQ